MRGPLTRIGSGVNGRSRQVRRRSRRIALAATLSLAATLAPAAGAQAAFPGANGRIAFDEYTGTSYDINSVDPSGADPTTLATSPADELDPSYSASGQRIVYDRILVGSGSGYDIWRMRADGTGKKQLTHGPADDEQPCYSPTGTEITFIRDGDLWVMRADGTKPHRVKDLTNGGRPAWSPDGKLIAYQDGPTLFSHDIYVVRPDGTHVHRLTRSPKRANSGPDWSPSGRQLVFARLVGGIDDLFVMRRDGSQMHPILTTPYDEFRPAYSPSGRLVVYNGNNTTAGYQNIFRATIGTGMQHQLSFDLHNEYDPAWQPL